MKTIYEEIHDEIRSEICDATYESLRDTGAPYQVDVPDLGRILDEDPQALPVLVEGLRLVKAYVEGTLLDPDYPDDGKALDATLDALFDNTPAFDYAA